jgi:hypothetical protein
MKLMDLQETRVEDYIFYTNEVTLFSETIRVCRSISFDDALGFRILHKQDNVWESVTDGDDIEINHFIRNNTPLLMEFWAGTGDSITLFDNLVFEMANLVISGPSEPYIEVYASTKASINGQHWKRVKVLGPNNTQGTVPWESKKLPVGNLTDRTIKISYQFINTYVEFLDALWNGQISDTRFKQLYAVSKTDGLNAARNQLLQITGEK